VIEILQKQILLSVVLLTLIKGDVELWSKTVPWAAAAATVEEDAVEPTRDANRGSAEAPERVDNAAERPADEANRKDSTSWGDTAQANTSNQEEIKERLSHVRMILDV
jgi:hypothetical protein